MKIEDIFGSIRVMSGAVPLSITELGFTYLNDIGMWNITVNWKHDNCIDKKITVKQLLELFESNCSCYWNQEDVFEEKRQQMIELVKQCNLDDWIEFE